MAYNFYAMQFKVKTPQLTAEKSKTKEESKTKLEVFQSKTGSVVIEGYYEIGSVLCLDITAMELTDVTSGEKQTGVEIRIGDRNRPAFIDYDEVDSLVQGIDYISKATKKITQFDNFEAIYRTKDGFKLFVNSSGDIDASIKGGKNDVDRRACSLSPDVSNLSELRTLIIQAKQKLDSARVVR
jgi:hypothetical protein